MHSPIKGRLITTSTSKNNTPKHSTFSVRHLANPGKSMKSLSPLVIMDTAEDISSSQPDDDFDIVSSQTDNIKLSQTSLSKRSDSSSNSSPSECSIRKRLTRLSDRPLKDIKNSGSPPVLSIMRKSFDDTDSSDSLKSSSGKKSYQFSPKTQTSISGFLQSNSSIAKLQLGKSQTPILKSKQQRHEITLNLQSPYFTNTKQEPESSTQMQEKLPNVNCENRTSSENNQIINRESLESNKLSEVKRLKSLLKSSGSPRNVLGMTTRSNSGRSSPAELILNVKPHSPNIVSNTTDSPRGASSMNTRKPHSPNNVSNTTDSPISASGMCTRSNSERSSPADFILNVNPCSLNNVSGGRQKPVNELGPVKGETDIPNTTEISNTPTVAKAMLTRSSSNSRVSSIYMRRNDSPTPFNQKDGILKDCELPDQVNVKEKIVQESNNDQVLQRNANIGISKESVEPMESMESELHYECKPELLQTESHAIKHTNSYCNIENHAINQTNTSLNVENSQIDRTSNCAKVESHASNQVITNIPMNKSLQQNLSSQLPVIQNKVVNDLLHQHSPSQLPVVQDKVMNKLLHQNLSSETPVLQDKTVIQDKSMNKSLQQNLSSELPVVQDKVVNNSLHGQLTSQLPVVQDKIPSLLTSEVRSTRSSRGSRVSSIYMRKKENLEITNGDSEKVFNCMDSVQTDLVSMGIYTERVLQGIADIEELQNGKRKLENGDICERKRLKVLHNY